MRSVNKVIIIGNLTRDSEVRTTPNGQLVSTFGVATNREWLNQKSERKSLTEFHEVVAWAKLAELAEKHLKKGKLVYIEGYLSTRSWETPDGGKKFKTEIVAQDIIILNRKDDADGTRASHVPRERAASKPEVKAEAPAETVATETVAVENPVPTETVEAPAAQIPTEQTTLEETTSEATPAQNSEAAAEMASVAPKTPEHNDSDNIIDRDLGL